MLLQVWLSLKQLSKHEVVWATAEFANEYAFFHSDFGQGHGAFRRTEYVWKEASCSVEFACSLNSPLRHSLLHLKLRHNTFSEHGAASSPSDTHGRKPRREGSSLRVGSKQVG